MRLWCSMGSRAQQQALHARLYLAEPQMLNPMQQQQQKTISKLQSAALAGS
jgi:hypothetical protein